MQLKEPIGKGMFGELYRGVDALGIDVAVKFIRQTGVQADFALNQAKALARAMHPNVVAVYTFEDIHDPVTGKEQPAILMEMVEGLPLKDLLKREPMALEECRRIGEGLLNGIEHIHKQSLQHGDLHSENVLVGLGSVKIIDILYYNTMATISTQSQGERFQADITALRGILRALLNNTQLDASVSERFSESVGRDA